MLELKQIYKRFGEKTVAANVNLQVENGKLLAVLGASGSGKSTLLNIIAGLLRPDSGEVWINQVNQNGIPPERRRIAFMFQDYALLPHLNVWQNVAFGLKMQGMAESEAKQQAEAVLAEVGLAAESGRKVHALSGGEQQRVALARALVIRPQVLLLDEAFSSLDTGLRQQLRLQTLAHIRRQNIPAVMVTHDPEEAFLLADHIALLQNGRVIQCDTPQKIMQAPANAEAARLIGAANIRAGYHIPQHAIHFDHPAGSLSRISHVLYLPESCQITLQHPEYGELEWIADWQQMAAQPLQTGDSRPVWIDENAVIRFDTLGQPS